jgi:uncharacterized repeat protein (TIGR03803 family)
MSKIGYRAKNGVQHTVARKQSNCAARPAMRPRDAAALTLAAAIVLGTGAPSSALAKGPTFKLIYTFPYAGNGPYYPLAGLVADKLGNLYGTTNDGPPGVAGTVYKFAPNGTITTLHEFVLGGADGSNPYAAVIFDKAGNLYGTTTGGGSGGNGFAPDGTVFEVASDGTETLLHSFTGAADGGFPIAGLMERHGNLYGTTSQGGSASHGVVFEVTSRGATTVLHTFTGGKDGIAPWGGLIADKAGNLYGMTSGGGKSSSGTVYKIAPNAKETVLYAFKGGNDGADPEGALILDKAGNLYGTTSEGGADNVGTAFMLAPDGTETVLYSFNGGTDGAYPTQSLFEDTSGNFFGTTQAGGAYNVGTVFSLTPSGVETVLYTFTGGNDGSYPYLGGLITDSADQKGALFGTTYEGGASDGGTIFSIENYKRPMDGIQHAASATNVP